MQPSSRNTLRDLRDRVTKAIAAIEGSKITNEMCAVVLEILMEMQNVSVSVEDLSATQIGKAVNNVRTIFASSNDVVSICKALTDKWKGAVLEHRQNIKEQLRRRAESVKDESPVAMQKGSRVLPRTAQKSLDNDTLSTEADSNFALSSYKENFASLHSGYTTSTLPYYKDLLSKRKSGKNPPVSQSPVAIKREPVSDDEGEMTPGSSRSRAVAGVSCDEQGAGVTEVKLQRAAKLQQVKSAAKHDIAKKANVSRSPASGKIGRGNNANKFSKNSHEALTDSTKLVGTPNRDNSEDHLHKGHGEPSSHKQFILNQSKILERSESSYDNTNTHCHSNDDNVPHSWENFDTHENDSSPRVNTMSTERNSHPNVDDPINENGSPLNSWLEDEVNDQVGSQSHETGPHSQVKRKRSTSYASSVLELKSIVWNSMDAIREIEERVSILKDSFRRAQNEINRLTQMCPELRRSYKWKKNRKRKKSAAPRHYFISGKKPNHGHIKARPSDDTVDGQDNEASHTNDKVGEGAEIVDLPRDDIEESVTREDDSLQTIALRNSGVTEDFEEECRGSTSNEKKDNLGRSISSLTGLGVPSTPQPSISSSPIVHKASPVPVKRRVPLLGENSWEKESGPSASSELDDMLCFTQVVDDMETSRELPPPRAEHLRDHKQKYRRFWNEECKKKSGLHYSSLAKNGGVGALKAIHKRHVARQAIQLVVDKQVKDRIARVNSLP